MLTGANWYTKGITVLIENSSSGQNEYMYQISSNHQSKKHRPHGGIKGKVIESPKSVGFILWGPWTICLCADPTTRFWDISVWFQTKWNYRQTIIVASHMAEISKEFL